MQRDDQGLWIDDNEQLQGLVNIVYKKLFSIGLDNVAWFQTETTYPILSEEIGSLATLILDEEVQHAVFSEQCWTSLAGLRHVVLNSISRFDTVVVVLMKVFMHEVDTIVSSIMMLIWSMAKDEQLDMEPAKWYSAIIV
jgi:hypothetical protein